MLLAPLLAVALAVGPAAQQHSSRRPKMVVLSVRALDAAVKPTAELLGEVLLTEIHKSQRFELIGESELVSLIGLERQRQLLGCTEASCLAEIGGALGCEYIFLSSLGMLDREYRVDLRLVDAKRSRVMARDGAVVGSKQELLAKVKELIGPMLVSVPLAPQKEASAPAQATPVEHKPLEPPAQNPTTAPPPKEASPAPALEELPKSEAVAVSSEQPAKVIATQPKSRWLPYSLLGGGALAAVAGGVLVAVTVSGKEELRYSQASGRINAGGALAGLGVAAALVGGGMLLFAGADPDPAVALSADVRDGPFVSVGGDF